MCRVYSPCFTVVFALHLLLLSSIAYGKVEVFEFDDPKKTALYQQMIQELRCLVCQNQNLADSNAELAVDLRRRTRELILQGKSRRDITEYMVERYGEFVIYRPRLNVNTIALWFSPAVLLLLCLWFVARLRRRKTHTSETFTASDRAIARDLLARNGDTRQSAAQFEPGAAEAKPRGGT